MAERYELEEGKFLDSSSIVHGNKKLSDILANTEGSITFNATNVETSYNNTYTLKKEGNLAILNIGTIAVNNLTRNTFIPIGTLPAGFIPSAALTNGVACIGNGNGDIESFARIQIQSTGTIRVKPTTNYSGTHFISAIVPYFTD